MSTKRLSASDQVQHNRERIWQTVSQIPSGNVASYGQVARLAGLPNASRLVGNVLKNLPESSQLPWHRVINAQGKISFKEGSSAYREQRLRLESEGLVFAGNKLSLTKYGWQP